MNSFFKSLLPILAVATATHFAQANGNRRSQRSTAQISQVLSSGKLSDGSFAGFVSDDQKQEYSLIVKSLSSVGRDESFLGFMMLTDASDKGSPMPATLAVAAYVIDPLERGSYMMVPMTLGPSNIGTFNDEPSLSLSVTSNRIAITPTKTGNQAGFRSAMSLTHDSLFSIQGAYTGQFARGAHKASVSKDAKTADLQASSQGLSLNGNYSLTETIPGLNLVKGRKVDTYGEQEESRPLALAAFISYVQDKVSTTALVLVNLDDDGASGAFSLPYDSTNDTQKRINK
jgi:hypothetical protein